MALTLANYRTSLRAFIKDNEALNRLIEFKEENTDDELDLYISLALSFANSIPPFLEIYTYGTFLLPNLIIHQAALECLISNGIVQSRNDLTYNNGGITVKVDDGDRYIKFIQILTRATDREISQFKQMKIAINISAGYGGVHSPYSYLHGRSTTLQPNSILDG